MKIARLLLLIPFIPVLYANSVLLSDSFSGSSVDLTKWTVILPLSTSSVVEGGGNLTTTGRGIIATNSGYSRPYIVNGAFTMLSDLEHFNIALRTNLSTPGSPFYEREGILVSFANDGNNISIQKYTSATDWSDLSIANYPLLTNQTYFFSIFDSGANISLAVNGVKLLDAQSTYSTGSQIAFYSRELPGTSTAIDAVNIVSVPDNAPTAVTLGLAIIALFCITYIAAPFPKKSCLLE